MSLVIYCPMKSSGITQRYVVVGCRSRLLTCWNDTYRSYMEQPTSTAAVSAVFVSRNALAPPVADVLGGTAFWLDWRMVDKTERRGLQD